MCSLNFLTYLYIDIIWTNQIPIKLQSRQTFVSLSPKSRPQPTSTSRAKKKILLLHIFRTDWRVRQGHHT